MVASSSELESFETVLSAQNAFRRAHQHAFWQTLLRRLIGRPTELCSFETVRKQLGGVTLGTRTLREIPLAQVVGSVGRSKDYTPSFLPRRSSDEARWVRIKRIINGTGGLPPLEVFQLGDHYFVEDGHHRVSVLKQMGIRHVEAWVTAVHSVTPKAVDKGGPLAGYCGRRVWAC